MSEHKTVRYNNGDGLTILWRPELCTHSGICVKTLPGVYCPTDRPWVKVGVASKEEIMRQIDLCPSKALTYELSE